MTQQSKDKTKPDMSLIPYGFLKQIAEVRRHGDSKYGPLERLPQRTAREMVAAMIRHCYEYLEGCNKDADSGFHPLAHVATGALVTLYQIEKQSLLDDRGYQKRADPLDMETAGYVQHFTTVEGGARLESWSNRK